MITMVQAADARHPEPTPTYAGLDPEERDPSGGDGFNSWYTLCEALPRPPFTDVETEEAAGHVYDYLWQRTQAGWRWRHSFFPISQPAQRARDCAPLVGISTNSRSLLQVSFYRENYRNYRGGQDLIESKGVNGNSRT